MNPAIPVPPNKRPLLSKEEAWAKLMAEQKIRQAAPGYKPFKDIGDDLANGSSYIIMSGIGAARKSD